MGGNAISLLKDNNHQETSMKKALLAACFMLVSCLA
jgi:hypothetical protein